VFTVTNSFAGLVPLDLPTVGFTLSQFAPSEVNAAAVNVVACALLVFTVMVWLAGWAPLATATKYNPTGDGSGSGSVEAFARSNTVITY